MMGGYSSIKTKFWDQSIQGLSTNLESIGVYLGILHSYNIRVGANSSA